MNYLVQLAECVYRLHQLFSLMLKSPQHGLPSRGMPMKAYLDQLRDDTMCTNEELPIAMSDERNGGNM